MPPQIRKHHNTSFNTEGLFGTFNVSFDALGDALALERLIVQGVQPHRLAVELLLPSVVPVAGDGDLVLEERREEER